MTVVLAAFVFVDRCPGPEVVVVARGKFGGLQVVSSKGRRGGHRFPSIRGEQVRGGRPLPPPRFGQEGGAAGAACLIQEGPTGACLSCLRSVVHEGSIIRRSRFAVSVRRRIPRRDQQDVFREVGIKSAL